MVYQFALPGLVLYSLYQADATVLMNWLRTIPPAPGKCLYLNVLATHDGIGVRPLEGILSDTEIAAIADNIAQTGGYTSSKKTAGGSLSPYELNSTYYSALATFQDESLNIKKYLASQAILLSLAGLPAIYIHSLFGTENDFEGVRIAGQKRSINRRKFDLSEIREILSNPENRMTKIFSAYQKMIKIRRQQRAFHPKGPQKVIPITSKVFSILRSSPDNLESIFVLINMTPEILPVTLPENIFESKNKICNLLTDSLFQIREEIELSPYEVLWLKGQK
jgi:sucrose phosphorylase